MYSKNGLSVLVSIFITEVKVKAGNDQEITPKTEVGNNQTNNQVLILRTYIASRVNRYFHKLPSVTQTQLKNMETYIWC